MKSIISLCFVALLAGSTIIGCKSDSTSSNNSAPSNGATIDGTAWTPDVPATAAYFTTGGGTVQVALMDTKSQMLQIVLPGAPKTGTFTVGGSTSSAFTGQFVKGGTTQYIITSGTVNVSTASTSHITGTFNFHAHGAMNAKDSVVVTNGGFDAAVISH